MDSKYMQLATETKPKKTEQAKKDTAELAKQYRQDIKAMQEAGKLPSDLFGYLIGKAAKEGGMTGKLNPKYIHKILRLEIANFYKKANDFNDNFIKKSLKKLDDMMPVM